MRTSYKYRILVILCSFALLLSVSNGKVSAHVLQENNGIAAVLHIPPDDNPVAGQTTALDFVFSSEQGNFSLVDCNCQVQVQRDGKTIQTTTLQHPIGGGTLDARAAVNFPAIDVYDVIVTGSSKSAKFKAFNLTYLERVATSAHAVGPVTSNTGSTVTLISGTSFLILAMVTYTNVRGGKRYAKSDK